MFDIYTSFLFFCLQKLFFLHMRFGYIFSFILVICYYMLLYVIIILIIFN